jgi:Icc-related predicted phosphoesterase
MKFTIMSDLHLEFHEDNGIGFIESLDPKDNDAIILAGDIAEKEFLGPVIALLCAKYPHVIMVPGNHEYYGSDAGTVSFNFDLIKESHSNFHLLDNDVLELDGQRFVGTTLWYPYVSPHKTIGWSDFRYILKFGDWVWEENKKSVNFLTDNVEKDDIVITHYLPSAKCIAKKYEEDPSNVFYLTNMEALIEERKPKIWVHGHTHTHVDVKVHDTRVIANPRGYTMFHETVEENGFDDQLTIEV